MSDPSPGRTPADRLVHDLEEVQVITYVQRHDHDDAPMIYISPTVEDVFGWSREEFMTLEAAWASVVHSDDRARWDARLAESETTGVWDEEYRVIDGWGRVRWVHDRAHIVPAAHDRPAMWVGWALDVTAAREARDALRDTDARYRALVERSPAAIFILTNEVPARVRYISPQIERFTGHTAEAWLADPEVLLRTMHPDDRERVTQQWTACVETATPFISEYRFVRDHGSIVWVRETTDPIRSDDGSVAFWQGVTLDITDRKLTEDALARSEARYRALVERLPAVVYVDSNEPEPQSLYVSPNVEEVLGHPPASYLKDNDLWFRTIHPDDLQRVRREWADSVQRQEPFHCRYRFVRPDGTVIWIRDGALPVRDEEGTTLFWQGVILDITAQKQAEHDLRESESRFRALVEQVPAVVYEMGPDDERRTIYVSAHVEDILGYSRREWLDQPDIWTELLHPDDREIELAEHDRHNETGEPWSREYRLIASDGRVVWVRDQAVLVRDADLQTSTWQGVMLDITAQKEAEEDLRRAHDELEFRVLARTADLAEANEMMSLEIGERRRVERQLRGAEERYRLLVEHLPGVAYVWQIGSRVVEDHPMHYTSPQIEALLGYTVSEWEQEGGFWRSRLHPHDRERVLAAAERSRATGKLFNEEYRYLARDGRVVWVLDQATLLARDEQGRPELFQGVMLSITRRKEAEAKAADAEASFRQLTEKGPVIAYTFDLRYGAGDLTAPELQVTYVSPQIADVLGFPLETLRDYPERWLMSVHPDDRERVTDQARRSWGTGEAWSHDYRMLAADGRVVWLHDAGRMLARDEDGRPLRFQGVLLDVTARSEVEARLREAEERHRALLERTPAIPWIEVAGEQPGNGRMVYMGPQVEDVLGYRAEELLDEPGHFARMVHEDDRERVLALSIRCDATGEPWDAEYRAIARDGRVLWLLSRAVATRDEQDRLVWHGITMDITALKERERANPPASSASAPQADVSPSG